MKEKKFHYAWLILVSCCVMQGIGIGIISNCNGIYFTPICEDLGFSMGTLTFYKTLSGIFSILSLLVTPKLFKKLDVRGFAFFLIFVAGGANFAMAFGTKIWHWYVLGILQGLTLTTFSHFIPVTLINTWFQKRVGFAMGISCAASGGVGMVMSQLLSNVIVTHGWRASAMLNGAICVGVAAPFVLLVIRKKPEDLGLLAYGEEAGAVVAVKEEKEEEKRTFKLLTASFLMIVVFGICAKATVGYTQYLAGYGKSLPVFAGNTTILLTLYLFGNMCFKFIFGYTNDKLGTYRSTILELSTVILGLVLLLTHVKNLMLVGAVVFGACAMMGNVQVPLIVRKLWSKEEFARTYANVSMIADASFYASITLFGVIYDAAGKYEPLMVVCIGCAIVEMTMASLLFLKKRKAA